MVLQALVDHVQLLRRQHRAGINEFPGQLDQLFELADLAQRELDHAPALRPLDTNVVAARVDSAIARRLAGLGVDVASAVAGAGR